MLLVNANLATMMETGSYGLISNGAVAIRGETIVWAGEMAKLPADERKHDSIDVEGRLVTPGLIDCHSHIVHGGNRADEFEMRLNGASYEEVALAGGGIVSTVRATRASDEAQLLKQALKRVDHLIGEGVTTLEIKSGYGLDRETELKMLRTARQIGRERALTVRTSFLGAHAVPQEYKGNGDAYLDEICIPTLKAAHEEGLVDAVDGFCEGIAFSPDQIRRLFEVASALKLPVKLHAEQLSALGGARLAAEFGALSADHLEYAGEADAVAMAKAGTVGVMLPGAFYTLRETQLPPIGLFRKHGVKMAVASDVNPGSSPLASLLLAMNMAATLFRMTPCETLAGTTRNAAAALGFSDRGRIAPGQRADLAIWDGDHPAELSYSIGFNPLWKRIYGGKL